MRDWLFRQRHPLKLFKVDGRRYVADLVTGQVIPIDLVTWELLEAAPPDSEDFIETLRQKYPDSQIDQAIKRLRNLRERGTLFSPESEESPAKEIVPFQKKRPQLLLPAEFLAHRRKYDFLTNFNHSCLLTALAKKADIYIPITPQKEEEPFDFGEIGIHPLEICEADDQSPLKWIPKDCDGVLLLNPVVNPGAYESLYFEADVPVIVRWAESRQFKREMIECAISSVGLAKEWDAVCFTSSWTKAWFSRLLSRNDHFYTISSGLSLNSSAQPDKQLAKKAVAQFMENEAFAKKPVIGMILGVELQKAIPFLLKLAQRNSHLAFLVLDSASISLPMGKLSNIAFFGLQSLDDYQALPTLYAVMDLFCFPAGLGTPPSLVLEALNCGIAPVVVGGERLPEELGDAGLLIPSVIDRFGNPDFPIAELEAAFTALLTNASERQQQEAAARNAALRFSWDRAAEEMLQLLQHLRHKKRLASKTPSVSVPFVFTTYYDPSSRRVSPATFYLAEKTYRPLLEGLLLALEQRHRSSEIEQVRSAVHNRCEMGGDLELPVVKEPDRRANKTDSFAEQFDTHFRERAKIYPIGTNYLKRSYLKEVQTIFDSVWSRYRQQAQRPELFWKNMEDVVSDILWITGMSMEQLFQTQFDPPLGEEDTAFEAIKQKLYEHPLYPMTEHLYYIDFQPALHRGRFILKHLNQLPDEPFRFLDLGFGPGVLLSLILRAKPAWRGYGVDISTACHRYAQRLLERKGVQERSVLQVADVRQLPYSNTCFDLVVAMEVFEHVPNPQAGLSEALRVLKPEGFAIISIPVRLPIRMHLTVFSEVQEVLDLYHQFGLKILDFESQEFQPGQRVFTDTFAFLQKPPERR